MNWGDAGGWVAAVVALIGAVFVYGKLSQRVSSHDDSIRALWSAKSKQDDRLNSHGERLSALESRAGIRSE